MMISKLPAAAVARISASLLALLAALIAPHGAHAQAGPPYLSNDPGTPGNTNWEINLAVAPSLSRDGGTYQVPQIDLNYGLGDRIQLTYEIPYIVSSTTGQPRASGWGNPFVGIKWRFLDQGEEGWRASVFPQIEFAGTLRAQALGLAGPGPRYLLPVEVTKKFGPYDVDFEIGEYVPGNGPHERIMGLVAGRSVSPKLELDAELYDDRASGALPHETTLDVGGRYKLGPGIIALFMAGRSIGAGGGEATQFFGYFGVQILLTDYGLKLNRSD
jgi:hypothetical protein